MARPDPSIAKALAQIGAAGTSTGKKYIGVPDDYTTSSPNPRYTAPGTSHSSMSGHQIPGRQSPTIQHQPIYRTGGEYRQAPKSVEEIAQLQLAMVAAGLLDDGDYAVGLWDSKSASAMRELLGESNQLGADWRDTLAYRIDAGLGAAKKKAKNPPLTITKTSPTDIKAAVDAKAPDLLGRTLQPDEISPFVSGYNDLEVQAQTQAYNQQYSSAGGYGAGGTTVAQPDLGAYATQTIKDKYKQEVTGNTLGQNALEFLKLLTGSASGTPSGTGLPGHQT